MTAKLTFHPLGNADCTRVDLADGKKLLVDFANTRNAQDPYDKRIDLPTELKSDLRAAERDYYDVVCYTHLDDDHCCGSGDFFWLEHAAKYQGDGRIKIRELWVPAAAILEDGLDDSGRIVRQEARHRLRKGSGIRVFSRPTKLKAWLERPPARSIAAPTKWFDPVARPARAPSIGAMLNLLNRKTSGSAPVPIRRVRCGGAPTREGIKSSIAPARNVGARA